MKILHTGDIHLDSPFAGLSPEIAQKRRAELRAAFSDMIAYARTGSVDLLLIAGDLFDKNYVTRDTVALLRQEFSTLECPVVIAPGNHDPADNKSIWRKKDIFPENVHIFVSSTLSSFFFEKLNCRVYGYAFEEPSLRTCPLDGKMVENSSEINILCAHGDTTSPISPYGPLPAGALESFGADYYALSHIHNPDAANAALTVPGAYCGCPEGRDFGETGVKGAVLITLDKEHFQMERIRFCRKIYEQRTLNADGAADQGEILSAVRALIQNAGFGEDVLLRITLQGSTSPELSMDTAALAKAGGERLFYLEVRDETAPTWNAELLQQDHGMRGELYRVLLPRLESADAAQRETGSRALRYAMAALEGETLPLE